MEPPLIGITAGNHPKTPQFYVLRWDYVRSIELAGGIPIVLAPSGPALHSSLLERFDGLLLTGGLDVDPGSYNEEPHPLTRTNKERDEFEFALLHSAIRRAIPVLGICRGLQIQNVALGGTLIQDIPSEVGTQVSHNDPDRPRHQEAHSVSIVPGTALHRLLGCEVAQVNSFHHQAPGKLGRDLVVSAYAPDGVVEGLELPGHPYFLGV